MITVYTSANDTEHPEWFMERHSIDFQTVNVDENISARQLIEQWGFTQTPVVDVQLPDYHEQWSGAPKDELDNLLYEITDHRRLVGKLDLEYYDGTYDNQRRDDDTEEDYRFEPYRISIEDIDSETIDTLDSPEGLEAFGETDPFMGYDFDALTEYAARVFGRELTNAGDDAYGDVQRDGYGYLSFAVLDSTFTRAETFLDDATISELSNVLADALTNDEDMLTAALETGSASLTTALRHAFLCHHEAHYRAPTRH